MHVTGHGPPLLAAGPPKLPPQTMQMLVRFTEMGVQIFLPICALCCAACKSPARPRAPTPLPQLICQRPGVTAGQSWHPHDSALALRTKLISGAVPFHPSRCAPVPCAPLPCSDPSVHER